MPRTPSGAALAFIDVAVAHTGAACLPWPYNCNQQGYGLINYTARNGRAAVRALAGVGGGCRVVDMPPRRGHLRVPVTPAECRQVPPGCVTADAGDTGPFIPPADNLADTVRDITLMAAAPPHELPIGGLVGGFTRRPRRARRPTWATSAAPSPCWPRPRPT